MKLKPWLPAPPQKLLPAPMSNAIWLDGPWALFRVDGTPTIYRKKAVYWLETPGDARKRIVHYDWNKVGTLDAPGETPVDILRDMQDAWEYQIKGLTI